MSRSTNKMNWAQSLDSDFDLIGSSLSTKKANSKGGVGNNEGIQYISDNISVSSFRGVPDVERRQYNFKTSNMSYMRDSTPPKFSINKAPSYQSRSSHLPQNIHQESVNNYSITQNNLRTSEYSYNSYFGGNSAHKQIHTSIQDDDFDKTSKNSLTRFLGFNRPAFESPIETGNLKSTNLSRATLDNHDSRMGTFPRTKESPYDDTISTQGRLANPKQDIPLMLKSVRAHTSPRRVPYSMNDSIESRSFIERYQRDNKFDYKADSYGDISSIRRAPKDYRSSIHSVSNFKDNNLSHQENLRVFKGSDILSELGNNNIGRCLPDTSYTKRKPNMGENNFSSRFDNFHAKTKEELLKRIEIMQNHITQLKKQLDDANREIKSKDLNILQLEKQLNTNSEIRQSYRNSYTRETPEHNVYLEPYTSNKHYTTTLINKELSYKPPKKQPDDIINNIEVANPNLTRLKTILESARKREKLFDDIYKKDTQNTLSITDDDPDNKKRVAFKEDQQIQKSTAMAEQGSSPTTSNPNTPSGHPWISNRNIIPIEKFNDDEDPYVDFAGNTTNPLYSFHENVQALPFPIGSDEISKSNQSKTNRNFKPPDVNIHDMFTMKPKHETEGTYPVFPTEHVNDADSNTLKSKTQKSKTPDNKSLLDNQPFSDLPNKNTPYDKSDNPFNTSTIDDDPFSKEHSSPPQFPSERTPHGKNIHNQNKHEKYDDSLMASESGVTLHDNFNSSQSNPMKTDTVSLKPGDDNQHEDSCGSKSTESTTINVFAESNNEETIAEESPKSNLEENPDMSLIFSKKSLLNKPNSTTEFNQDVLDVKFFEVSYDSK